MKDGWDKIRILLIDDSPEALWRYSGEAEPPRPPHPGLADDFGSSIGVADLFELRWIATAKEGREFRDLSRLLAQHKPADLGAEGWVPEVVVVDYMLLDSNGTVEYRLKDDVDLVESLSPLPALRRLSEREQLKLGYKCERLAWAADTGKNQADYGCFVGGMILALFSDHPSVPVPTTAHSQQTVRDSMTRFFEWMLTEDTGAALYADGSKKSWTQIATEAAPRLRRRIEELARLRLVSLSLTDLLRLAEGHDLVALTIETKYGVRRLPINGLLCDKPAVDIQNEAQKWAAKLVNSLLIQLRASIHFPELSAATLLAEEVWEAYLDEKRVRERLELGKLVQALKNNESDQPLSLERLKELWVQFSTREFEEDYVTGTRPILNLNVTDIRNGERSNLARRWACLMILVRLLQLRRAALGFVENAGSELSEDDKRLLTSELLDYDVYLAWFPISSSPVDLKEVTSKSWAAVLSRDVDDPSTAGVSLNINDLLHGRPWQLGQTYGLKPGERELLHWYALSLPVPFPSSNWDVQAKRVLRGGA